MLKYIGRNVRYPEAAKAHRVEGTVFISLVVAEDGSVRAVKLQNGVEERVAAKSTQPSVVVVGYLAQEKSQAPDSPPAATGSVRSAMREMDEEALRVVREMSRWQFGQGQAGPLTIAIIFGLA